MQRFCKICHGWHDLDEPWPRNCMVKASISGIQIIKDIEPYMPVGADTDGQIHAVMGRRQHREFLRRNNYVEVGNEFKGPSRPTLEHASKSDIKNAIDQVRRR